MENIIPILRQFGISPDDLGPEKYEEMLKIGNIMKNSDTIDIEITRKIMDILGISTMKKEKQNEKPRKKYRRNDPCPCNSNKKYKKCCGASIV
jgi:uncharacterized protein YecA (UPF0149 family)